MSPHAPPQQVKTHSKDYNLDYKRAPDTDTQHTPAEATAMINTPRAHERGGDPTKHSQTSPTGGAETPTKLFDPNPWQTTLGYPGITPHFSPYLPLGLRLPGIPGIPPNFPMMSAADPLHMKAFSDPIMAYNSLRAFLPPHHFFPPPSFGFPLSPASSPFDKSMTSHLDSRLPSPHMEPKLSPSSLSLHGAKYSNTSSAFEPVISKYNLSPVSSNGELDLSLPSSTKRKLKEPEVTRYQCDGCNKSYSTYSGLSKHKQFHCTSQVQKEFSCKYCDKTYVSLGALKMHIRTHTLPCKCKLCGKAFSRPWLLQGHVRTHTGEKPFKCDHCGRAFADRSNLRAHLQTHSEVKKYSCKSCSKTFSRMSLLLKHEDGCTCGTPMMQ